MKLCKDCKHCVVENRECIHPNNVDVVTGKRDAKMCDDMRAAGGVCGPQGNWWWGKDIVDSKAEAPRLFDPTKVHHGALVRDSGTGTVPPERY